MLDKRTKKVVIDYLRSLYLNTFSISGLYYLVMFGRFNQDRDLYLTAFFYGTLLATAILLALTEFTRDSLKHGLRKNVKRIKKRKIREKKKQLIEKNEKNFYIRHRIYSLMIMILTHLENTLIKIANKFPTAITNLLAYRMNRFMISRRIEYFIAQPISPDDSHFKLSTEVENKFAIVNIDKPSDINLKPFRRAVTNRVAYYNNISTKDVLISRIENGVRVIIPLGNQ